MTKPFMDRFGKAHYAEEEIATKRTAFYAIIIKDGQVLLTAPPRFNLFEFPGGCLSRGEDYKTCLMRELYEEAGYDFALDHGEQQVHQVVNFFVDDIRPHGEYWLYDQTYIVYNADKYNIPLREGEWKTPENGTAKWVKLQDLIDDKITINYCHRQAFDKYLETNS